MDVVSTRRILEALIAQHVPADGEPRGGHTYRWPVADGRVRLRPAHLARVMPRALRSLALWRQERAQ